MNFLVAVDINATDRQTVEDFEAAIVTFDEVVAVRRLFGQPDYLVQVAVAVAYEAFRPASSSACPPSAAPSPTSP
jgi:Lrp/AsnC ligand binding domain